MELHADSFAAGLRPGNHSSGKGLQGMKVGLLKGNLNPQYFQQ
jgi:hypothetical protein